MKKAFVLLVSLWFLNACGPTTFFEQDKSIESKGWSYNDPVSFEFENKDSSLSYNLFLNLKYSKTYAYNNIFLFVDIEDPKKFTYRDTIECILSNPIGEWYGKVSGESIHQELVYRQNIKLPILGTYKLTFYQAMRDSNLINFENLGIKFKEFTPTN
jgi:gliding motility-associated lipoprotein GldH